MSKLLELSEEFAKEAFAANLCSITIHEDDSRCARGSSAAHQSRGPERTSTHAHSQLHQHHGSGKSFAR